MLVSPENFLKREHGLPFKNLRVWNIFWWEIIRYEASNVGTITTSKTVLKIQKKHHQYSFVDTIICLAKLRKCNILVLNHERRFYRCGKYIDQNTSTLVNDLYTAVKRVAVLQSAMTKAT